MTIRETRQGDLRGLLELYAHLQKEGRLEPDLEAERVWRRILREENHHILVAEEGGRILSSCVCVVVPNLTHGQRPYALVENVVTHPDFRGRGLASACLAAARIAPYRAGVVCVQNSALQAGYSASGPVSAAARSSTAKPPFAASALYCSMSKSAIFPATASCMMYLLYGWFLTAFLRKCSKSLLQKSF